MKYSFVVTGLALLVLANVLIVYQFVGRENFQDSVPNLPAQAAVAGVMGGQQNVSAAMNASMKMPAMPGMPGMNGMNGMNGMAGAPGAPGMNGAPSSGAATLSEGFSSYLLSEAAGAKGTYQSMGAYDGIVLPTGNNVSTWRYTAPNEKLLGDEFKPDQDNLFMFKNNQCKPECCGASFSCGGGCVCTTPQQRQYIAGRGGNRTQPEDSA